MRIMCLGLCAIVLSGSKELTAQTVQLPTFHTFSTDTTVLVPDQGTATLGGINRGRLGRNQFGGLPGTVARSGSLQSTRTSVNAVVHDFDAADRKLHSQTGQQRKPGGRTLVGDAPLGSVAELKRIHQARLATTIEESNTYLARARQAESEGKLDVAKVYYTIVARSADGELKTLALHRVASIKEVLAAVKNQPSARSPRGH